MPIVLLLFGISKVSHNLCIFHSPLTLLSNGTPNYSYNPLSKTQYILIISYILLHDKYKIWIGTLATRRWLPHSLVGAAGDFPTPKLDKIQKCRHFTRHST
jgi:hypothetical protein